MDINTVNKLNQYNKDFYKKVFKYFDSSRRYEWQGWIELYNKHLFLDNQSILDAGCGNGRFFEFLKSKLNISYTGIDSSIELINFAKERFQNSKFINADLLDITNVLTGSYDMITLFGVLHHIPGFETRKNLIAKLTNLLTSNGRIIFSVWNFKEDNKIISKAQNIDSFDLEPNDYFLSWERGIKATRYCHAFNIDEIKDIIEFANLSIEDSFLSDGKSQKLNTYYILKRK